MTNKRTIEISTPAYLSLAHKQLQIDQRERGKHSLPLDDLGFVVLASPQISMSQALLAACWSRDILVVMCDENYMPGAMLIPYTGHTLSSRITRAQVAMTQPRRKQIWRAIVRRKILEQANHLDSIGGDGYSVKLFAQKVAAGDKSNMEAQAARLYWPQLFGPSFRRDRDEPVINGMLNYGYAVLRAAVARAVVGAGLNPLFAVHHVCQYNAFALCDDLVEPLRPLVDRTVLQLVRCSEDLHLGREEKRELLKLFETTLYVGGDRFPFVAALQRYAASFRELLEDRPAVLTIPEIEWDSSAAPVASPNGSLGQS